MESRLGIVALMENGLLDRRESFDLLDNLDFGIMELGMSDEEPNENVTVEPVPIPDGNVSGGAQSTVSPPPLPTTASIAATTDEIAAGTGVGASALRNSVKSEAVEAAPVSTVGGGQKVLAEVGGSTGVEARAAVSGGSGGGDGGDGGDGGQSGGSGRQDGEQEIDVSVYPVCFLVVYVSIS